MPPEQLISLAEGGAEGAVPFLSPAFIDPYLELIAPSRGEFPVAGPLVSSRRGPWRVLHTLGAGLADYMELDLSDESTARSQMISWLGEKFDVAVIRNVPSDSPTGPFLRRLADSENWEMRSVGTGIAPFAALEGSWEEFFHRSRGKKARHNLRRSARRISEAGGRIRHYSTPEQLGEGLEAAFAIAAAEPRGTHTGWSFGDRRAFLFYKKVAERLSQQSQLDLAVLEIEAAPLAFAWSFKQGSTCYYHHARSISASTYSRLSPGSVLLMHLLRESIGSGIKIFDFMLGEESYKQAWATDSKSVSTHIVARRSLRGVSAIRTEFLLNAVRTRARRSPIARRSARSLSRIRRRMMK